GIDDDGLARKRATIDMALKRHSGILDDPLHVAAAVGGRELAALLGAALAARRRRIPVLIDGFVCTAALAPLAMLHPDGLAHAVAAHVSAEAPHPGPLRKLRLRPLVHPCLRLRRTSG